MDALTLLQELLQHMEWADAVVFTPILRNPKAEQDNVLLMRLRHLHLVQKVFFDVWQHKPIQPHVTDSMSARELALFAQSLHQNIQQFHHSLTPKDLDQAVHLPWAQQVSNNLGFDIAHPSLAQTLLQVTAHSSYHRGQINARLRELGVDPPMTDYIAWVWSHQPAPEWPASPA